MNTATKQSLRRQIIERLQKYSHDDVVVASRAVAPLALKDPAVSRATRILAYRPIAAYAEIDPSFIIDSLRGQAIIDYVASHQSAPMPQGQYDLILVPAFGYDKHGYRLGHGAGWYDRLLAGQPSAYKVGLALPVSYVDTLPHEPHDVKLDVIITA